MPKKNVRSRHYVEIGKRLRDLFPDKKNAEIARILGVPRNTLGRYLTGERLPTSESLLLIHRATGADLQWFLTGVRSDASAEKELLSQFLTVVELMHKAHRVIQNHPEHHDDWKDALHGARESVEELMRTLEREKESIDQESTTQPAG